MADGESFENSLYQEYRPLLTTEYTPVKQSIQLFQEKNIHGINLITPDSQIQKQFIFNEHMDNFIPIYDGLIITENYVICLGYEKGAYYGKQAIVFVLEHKLNLVRFKTLAAPLYISWVRSIRTIDLMIIQDDIHKKYGIYQINKDIYKEHMSGTSGYFCGTDASYNVILRESPKTFILLNLEGKIISRHQLKGELGTFYLSPQGRFYVLCADSTYSEPIQTRAIPQVYLYEIQPITL